MIMQFPDPTFRKEERLCSRKAIGELFNSGGSFYSTPFQVIWLPAPVEFLPPAQVAVSVAKRLFRKAVKRNLIKRRIREAYRKNKTILYEFLNETGTKVIFIIIYKSDSVPDYNTLEIQVRALLKKFVKVIRERVPDC